MSILIEMVANALTTAGLFGGLSAVRGMIHKKPAQTTVKPPSLKPDDVGGYPWAAMYSKTLKREILLGQYRREDIFKCPKCLSETAIKIKLCNDEHYHYEHFDFKCGECEFECFIRTADQINE